MLQDRLTFDTEFVAYGLPDNELVGFSFSYKHNGEWQGFYVPLNHKHPETRERLDWQLTQEQITPGLKRLLEGENVTLGGQNFKAEIQSVLPLGIFPTENVFDTMLVGYLLNTNGYGPDYLVDAGKGSLSLKDMSLWVLGDKQTKLKELNIPKEYDPKRDKNTLLRVDLVDDVELFAEYAIADTNQTGKLWDVFEKRLEAEPKLKKIYWNVHREFMFTLAEMESFGVELDTAPLKEMRSTVEVELQEIILELYMKRSGQDFPALVNPTAVKNAARDYDSINAAVAAGDRRSEFFPRSVKGEPNPNALGTFRTRMAESYGLKGHPVWEKIKDEKLRPWLISHPHLAHKVFKVGSDLDLARVFFDEEHMPMLGEKFGKAKESTAKEVVKVWAKEYDNEMAKLLLKFRIREKLLGTYLIGLPRMLGSDERLHGRFNQTGARTGRLSSSDPNLQNQPTNKKYPIRRAYVAQGVSAATVFPLEWAEVDGEPTRIIRSRVESVGGWYEIEDGRVKDWGGKNPPWVMFVGDYSQLEIRLLAHMSQDPVLMAAVLDDVDIHSLTARDVIDPDIIPSDLDLKEVKKQFPKSRDKAKTANFGVIYGMGPYKFARDYGYTLAEAEEIINVRWMGLYTGVAEWIKEQHQMATDFGFVQTAIGQKRHLPAARFNPVFPCNRKDLEAYRKQVEEGSFDPREFQHLEKLYEASLKQFRLKSKAMRQAQNAPIQGFAANVVGIAQRNLRRWMKEDGLWGTEARMLLQVHDEVVSEFHPSQANELMQRSVSIMEGVFDLSVPLGVSAALGHSWLDAKE